MDFSSHQAAQIRFTAPGPGYDQREVEEFRHRVRNALAFYERNWDARDSSESPPEPVVANPESRGGGDEAAAHLAAARAEAARVMAAAEMEADDLIAAATARAASLSAGPISRINS